MKPIILPKEIKFNVIKTAKGKTGTMDSITIKKHPKTGPHIPSKLIKVENKYCNKVRTEY